MNKTNKKYALFAYNGETLCFVHALLNALDMKEKGYDVKLIVEGTATKQVKELSDPAKPFANLYGKVLKESLVDGVCRACAAKTGSLKSAQSQGIRLLDDMSNHPGFARYLKEGFEIITF
ncbi:MAG: cytoplasmic protein [Spirochaetes bacterium]|nr:cytoplasmic protein [Spirochaetota bacterium]